MTKPQAVWFQNTFATLTTAVNAALLGKAGVVQLVVAALLAEGHVLLEDMPGTGKTSLAKAISAAIQGTHQRIQFTPDVQASDITGMTVYNQASRQFEFHQGPVFANIVHADEINRASPKTQSALLEVMAEGQVTVDGASYAVGQPFMVIATQSPIEHLGTYRLPESQLDRFLIKTAIGRPDAGTLREILADTSFPDRAARVTPVITASAVTELAELAASVHVDASIVDYVSRLMDATHDSDAVSVGLSVRGGIAMMRAAKVWAAHHGRHFVIPEDVRQLAHPVWGHRIFLTAEAEFAGEKAATVIDAALALCPAPLGTREAP